MKIKLLSNLIALKVEAWHMKVGDGSVKAVSQEPGDEERGSYDRAEEVGKASTHMHNYFQDCYNKVSYRLCQL